MLQKRKPIRERKILDAADGEACTWPGCEVQDGTVVAAHSNEPGDGKGMRLKADDIYIAFLCFLHHGIYDGRIEADEWSAYEKQTCFTVAMKKTWRRLWERGVIGVNKNG